MIYNNLGKPLTQIGYFDEHGTKKMLTAIYKALEDGALRLVWRKHVYLIITPESITWVHPEFEIDLTVNSNVSWINF